ncbi:MAG TPA: acetylornithine transaminase [Chloroflexota bacterium]|nr:acetylornithine transaminase [Chloroflexota bacterium]
MTVSESQTSHTVLAPGSTVVIKLGGATLDGGGAPLEEVAALVRSGLRAVIVHGGGALISQWLERIGVPTRFQDGVRVTDEPALEVATMVLRGVVNTGVVAGLARFGVAAAGLSGVDDGLLRARRKPELGLVGEVESVNTGALNSLLDQGVVPVIAPLGLDAGGALLNINADTAAAAIAAALEADAALFMTDVPGVRDAGGSMLPHLDSSDVERLIAEGVINGGMIPKVRACLEALRGARMAAILDGRTAGALSDLLEDAVAGTIVTDRHHATEAPSTGDDDTPLTRDLGGEAAVAAREAHAYMHTFRREPLVLVRGRGTRVWDETGRRYLDLVAGIAVNVLGHAHPAVATAIARQARTLIHTSNLYYTLPQLELAEMLLDLTGMEGVFFTNSGAEANEAAIKIARKWGKRYKDGAYEIVCAENSFHGRTLATVAATGKRRYQEPFEPMPAGFVHVPFNDLAALDGAIGPRTAAVLLEPIQGEGGVYPAAPGYLAAVRRLCDERQALLMLDEVQTGIGRTGTFLACQGEGVVPDVVTLAKGLGGGTPLGAALARGTANVFEPGDHGSTLGGNPLACAAGVATLRVLRDEGLLAHTAEVGAYFKDRLQDLSARGAGVKEVRGRGLMLAAEVDAEGSAVVAAMRQRGVLVNSTGPTTIRMVPPLILAHEEVDETIAALEGVLG